MGPAGPTGPTGAPGVVAANGTGAYDFANVNGFVSSGTPFSGALGASGPGSRMVWYPRNGAFRAGFVNFDQWDENNIGLASVAIGNSPVASGHSSISLGSNTSATGEGSVAIGSFNTVSATNSVAIGYSLTASGHGSMALGAYASTNSKNGSFVYGDDSTAIELQVAQPNQFVVRAAGGTIFYSNAALTTGVALSMGGGAFNSLSDVRMKANFRDLDGEDVLAKLARIPIREWNYISQDAAIRHVGPTAQDFHAAFGLGDNDRTISTLDPDGISLRAIQALDARTDATRTEVTQLREDNAALKAELAALREAIADLRRQR